MGRWGEDEKKSRGIGGCLFALVLLVGFGAVFYQNYQNLENRRALEKEMQNIVRRSHHRGEVEVHRLISIAANELGLNLKSEDIEVTRELDDYSNPIFTIRIEMKVQVSLLVTSFEMSLPIYEKINLIT